MRCGSFAAGLCLTRSAFADPDLSPGLSIAWDAPGTCPDVAHVRTTLAALLAGSTPGRGPELVAKGSVTGREGRFVLRIQLDSKGASETKTMGAGSCQTLVDAFAIVVAFTFDPTVGPRPPAAVDPPQPERATSIARRSEPPLPPAAGPGTRIVAGPLIALGAGALPFPAYGVGARLAVETGPRWELAGMFWPEQSASVVADASHTVGAGVWLAALQPSVCVSFARGAVASCAGGELGAMQARGTGIPVPGSGTSWWLALTAGLSLRATVAQGIFLRVRIDVGVPFFRPTFVLENVGPGGSVQAFQPAAVFGALSIEPEFQLFSTGPGQSRHVSH
jgi:hypothetical protein